jgi:hypothetical protein
MGDKAGATGLEPATSGVTGRRSNQLSYAPAFARVVPLPAALRASPVCQPAALLAFAIRPTLSSSAPDGKLASQPVFV